MGIIAPLVILCYLILIGILLYIVKHVKGESQFKKITGKNIRLILAAYVVMIFAKGILLTLILKVYNKTTNANNKALNALLTDRTTLLMISLFVVLVP